jgi:L-methionine (R)-S-oxide reductase
LLKDGELLGVLDVDSPRASRFEPGDVAWLERFAETLARYL